MHMTFHSKLSTVQYVFYFYFSLVSLLTLINLYFYFQICYIQQGWYRDHYSSKQAKIMRRENVTALHRILSENIKTLSITLCFCLLLHYCIFIALLCLSKYRQNNIHSVAVQTQILDNIKFTLVDFAYSLHLYSFSQAIL